MSGASIAWRLAVALAAVAAITMVASIDSLRVGAAAAGLLYLLPVLWVSAQAGLGAGLAGAAGAAVCYNFFLLEPRYTLRIHGVDDVAAFVVLMIVAVVTSQLASGLRVRELDARDQADASAAEAEFAALLAQAHDLPQLDREALAWFDRRHGDAMLVAGDALAAHATGLSPLDAAAAAWALHNHAPSGHASTVMSGADFRFVPLARGGGDVLALAAHGRFALAGEPHLAALARLWAQARDRLTAEAERRAREEADQREGVRRALLAALGHDFRTPLTVLKAGLREIGGAAAERLAGEVDRVARLGEDLIAAARLENGQPARLEPIDLVDPVAAAVQPHLGGDIAVVSALPNDLPLVDADAVMLTHLIGNLVENAVRHARAAVRIAAAATAADVELTVSDDGPGIDPAVAAVLFDPFTSGSDRTGGSGLGLAIARDLAQAMGGSLSAADAPGGGACFKLRLRATLDAGGEG